MTTEQFYYWLNGFIETMETSRPSEQQWEMVKAHAALVAQREVKLPHMFPTNPNIWQQPHVVPATFDLQDEGLNTIMC